MANQLFKNNAGATLNGTIAIGNTTINVAAGQGAQFPAPTAGDYFLLTIYEKDVGGVEFNYEVVKVTARTADTLTVVRDFEGLVVAGGGTSGGWAYPSSVGLNPSQVVYLDLRYTAYACGNTLAKDDNLASVASAATARINLGLGNVENKTFAVGTADATHAATSKTTPVDADEIPMADSAASWGLKKLTWANLKATLKSYFDSLYPLRANNLSDLANAGTARTNLGLGTLATQSGTFSGTSSGTNTGDDAVNSTAAPVAHVGAGGTAHSNVVAAGAAGFMTGADKTKLDGIASGATAYSHPANHAPSIITQDASNRFVTDAEKAAWNAKQAGGSYAGLGGNTFSGTQAYSDQLNTQAIFKDCGFAFLDKGSSGTTAQTLDYTAGSHQKLTVSGAFTLSTSNWPPSDSLGELLLELVNGASSAVTWPTINWVKSDGSFTTTFASNGVTLQTSGTDFVMLWTRDAGTTVYGKIMR